MPIRIQISEDAKLTDHFIDMPERSAGWSLMERCARICEKDSKFVAEFFEIGEDQVTKGKTKTTVPDLLTSLKSKGVAAEGEIPRGNR